MPKEPRCTSKYTDEFDFLDEDGCGSNVGGLSIKSLAILSRHTSVQNCVRSYPRDSR